MIQIGIIISLVIAVLLGAIASKKVKGKLNNFFVAGRSWSALLVGLALVSQAIDGNATMANTGLAFDFGFWTGAAMIMGLALSLLLLGIFFAPKLNQLKLLTLADFFRYKYNRKIEIIAALFMLFSFGMLLAGNIASVAILIQLFWPIGYASIVIIICSVVILYAIGGGIISDLFSDMWQIFLTVAGIAATFIFLFCQYDFAGLWQSEIVQNSFSLSQLTDVASGSLINWGTIVALGFGNILAIDFCSRVLSAKSPQAARRGCYLGAFFTMLLGIPFALLPIFLQWLNVLPVENTPIIVAFANQILPPVIATLLISGIIAAALSTIDGAMLSMGNIFTHNILDIQKNIDPENKRETNKTYLYFARLSLLPVTLLAMIFAILLPTPGALLTIAFDIMFAALLVPFVTAFYSKKPNPQAAVYAIIAGAAARFVFAALTPTSFGVPNEWFYIPNDWFPASLDGLGTMVSPLVALVVYLAVVFVYRLRKKEVIQEEIYLNNNLQNYL